MNSAPGPLKALGLAPSLPNRNAGYWTPSPFTSPPPKLGYGRQLEQKENYVYPRSLLNRAASAASDDIIDFSALPSSSGTNGK